MNLAFKYRLLPTKKQHADLGSILESQRQLYNAALQERIGAYRRGVSINYFKQQKSLTECRAVLPEMASVLRMTQEATLKKLDLAFAAFFRRVKAGGKPGFPRFRSRDRWRSFSIRDVEKLAIHDTRLRLKGVRGSLRFHAHRPLKSDTPTNLANIGRDSKGWYISFLVSIAASPIARQTEIGVDVGLMSLAALSTGELIPNPRVAKRAEQEMRRRQRALTRCKRGSKRRQKVKADLGKLHQRIVNTRTTYLHQVSARLTREYGLIAVEKLNVAGMVKGNLARSIHDVAWSQFKFMLGYKAEKVGGRLIEVNPKFTSQDCSGCGDRVAKTLSVREHACKVCGLVLDRDVNAAKNILHKAKSGLEAGNVAQWSKRRPGNIGGSI